MTSLDCQTLFLSPPPSRRSSKPRIKAFDLIFLTLTLTIILGGCLFLLDVGAARSAGHETSMTSVWMSQFAASLPALFAAMSKYALLLIGSVINSAFLVLLVTSLRSLDWRISRRRAQRSPLLPARRPGMENVRRPAIARPASMTDCRAFLLSPVIR